MTTYEHITYNSNKVQVDSAIRDGNGLKINTNYLTKKEAARIYATKDELETAIETGEYTAPKYWGITIDETVSDPSTRVQYTQDLNTGQGIYKNAIPTTATPMSGAGSSFNIGSWGSGVLANLIEGIKPVAFDGSVWRDLDKSDATQWALTTNENAFTEFPFRWLSITKNENNVVTVIFSNTSEAPDNTFQNYAFLGADGVTQRPNFHIGCYPAKKSGTVLTSKPGSGADNINASYYWYYAYNMGSEFDCITYAMWVYMQMLFYVLFKSTDTAAMADGAYKNTNLTYNALQYGNSYGIYGNPSDTYYKTTTSFFWVQALHDRHPQLTASILVSRTRSYRMFYVLESMADPNKWDNNSWGGTGYAIFSNVIANDAIDTNVQLSRVGYAGYIYGKGNNELGVMIQSGSGSSTTYYPGSVYTSNMNAGGSTDYPYFIGLGRGSAGSKSGWSSIFVDADTLSGYASNTVTSRLAYRGGRT